MSLISTEPPLPLINSSTHRISSSEHPQTPRSSDTQISNSNAPNGTPAVKVHGRRSGVCVNPPIIADLIKSLDVEKDSPSMVDRTQEFPPTLLIAANEIRPETRNNDKKSSDIVDHYLPNENQNDSSHIEQTMTPATTTARSSSAESTLNRPVYLTSNSSSPTPQHSSQSYYFQNKTLQALSPTNYLSVYGPALGLGVSPPLFTANKLASGRRFSSVQRTAIPEPPFFDISGLDTLAFPHARRPIASEATPESVEEQMHNYSNSIGGAGPSVIFDSVDNFAPGFDTEIQYSSENPALSAHVATFPGSLTASATNYASLSSGRMEFSPSYRNRAISALDTVSPYINARSLAPNQSSFLENADVPMIAVSSSTPSGTTPPPERLSPTPSVHFAAGSMLASSGSVSSGTTHSRTKSQPQVQHIRNFPSSRSLSQSPRTSLSHPQTGAPLTNLSQSDLIEMWLDEHPDFTFTYFMKKGSRRLVNQWLSAHEHPSTSSSSTSPLPRISSESGELTKIDSFAQAAPQASEQVTDEVISSEPSQMETICSESETDLCRKQSGLVLSAQSSHSTATALSAPQDAAKAPISKTSPHHSVLLDAARLLFEEQADVSTLAYKILSHTMSLLRCERAQLLLVDDRCLARGSRTVSNASTTGQGTQGTANQGGINISVPAASNDYFTRLFNESKMGMFSNAYDLTRDENGNEHEPGLPSKKSPDTSNFPLNLSLTTLVATSGEIINIPNAYEDERFDEAARRAEAQSATRTRSILCAPIKNSTGNVLGVFYLVNKQLEPAPDSGIATGQESPAPTAATQPDGEGTSPAANSAFSTSDIELLEAFAVFCGLSIANTKLYENAMRAIAKQQVALEVLSYHAVAPLEDALRLKRTPVPTARYYHLNEFSFNDQPLTDDDTLRACLRMFLDLNLLQLFQIDYAVLCRFLLSVKKNYRNVTYHNWRHAFNVAQCMFAIVKSGSTDAYLGPLEQLALLVACLCHDLDHRGTNNQFQIKSWSPLAQLYSTSVMEHHHFDQCCMILNTKGNEILDTLRPEQYERVIFLIEQAILATDLALYYRHRDEFFRLVDTTRPTLSPALAPAPGPALAPCTPATQRQNSLSFSAQSSAHNSTDRLSMQSLPLSPPVTAAASSNGTGPGAPAPTPALSVTGTTPSHTNVNNSCNAAVALPSPSPSHVRAPSSDSQGQIDLEGQPEQEPDVWVGERGNLLLQSMLMTACDVSSAVKPWEVQRRVVELVYSEFFEQGDIERAQLHIEPSEMMDRFKKHKLPAMQRGFLENICLPLYQSLHRFSEPFSGMLTGCQANLRNWQALAEAQASQDASRSGSPAAANSPQPASSTLSLNANASSAAAAPTSSGPTSPASAGSANAEGLGTSGSAANALLSASSANSNSS